ncbi:MAG: hypothetical protein HQL66_03380 [Magnetococcales bacterium]|nr:hypothetical protein [Magnetococcales bacterium]
MDQPVKNTGTNPFAGARGKALHRLEPDVPFWWRKVTSRMVTMRAQQLRVDSHLPFTRTDLEPFFAAELPPPRKKPAENPPALSISMKKAEALAGLEDKLDLLMTMIRPPNNQGRVRQSPVPIHFGGQRLAFWEKDPPLRTGDHVEIHLGLFPDEFMLVHGYAQVIQTTLDPQSGLTRIFCQMVTMDHGGAGIVRALPQDLPAAPAAPTATKPVPAVTKPAAPPPPRAAQSRQPRRAVPGTGVSGRRSPRLRAPFPGGCDRSGGGRFRQSSAGLPHQR